MYRRGALGLVLCLGLVLAAPAAGGDIYSRKHSVDSRIGSLRSRIDAARARESTLSAQIAGVTAQIRRLESRVGDVSQHLATLQADLDLHKRRLARLTELYTLQTQRLVFLKQQYSTAVDRLSLRLIEVYEEDELNTVDVALSATSFSDLVDQLDYVRDLGQSDARIASDVGDARDSMRVARAKTKKVRATVGSETRVIAVRTDQVRAVRDSLLASSHKLSRARSAERASLASVRETKQAFIAEAEGLQQTSSQLAARIQAAQRSSPSLSASSAPGDSTPSSHGLIWPVNGPVTSPFGMRWGRMHEGIDIGVGYGTPIHAAASGTVVWCGWMSGYGNLTAIDHGGGLSTAYGHQSSIAVGCGQHVSQGQVIGYVGCTGHCFGPHLHFEVRINGSPVDPLGYL
jgi:murein DD-endopeptidase MepM/ murein hydrolase activator NlpD